MQFSVESYQEIKNSAQVLLDSSENYRSLCNRLLNVISEMKGSAWSGEDYEGFVANANELAVDLENLAKKLESSNTTLKQQVQNYENTQSSTYTAAKSLPT